MATASDIWREVASEVAWDEEPVDDSEPVEDLMDRYLRRIDKILKPEIPPPPGRDKVYDRVFRRHKKKKR